MDASPRRRHTQVQMGAEKMAYAVIVPTRNGGSTIKQTIDSILRQSLRAAQICVVDDGSTDETPNILNAFVNRDKLEIVSRPDRGYDIRRVPANLNLAYSNLDAAFHYLMISGDDCIYPKDYARSIISRMASEPRIVVASGRPRTGGSLQPEHLPSGSGRMVRHSFWQSIGGHYPQKVGWEAWVVYKALQEGLEVPVYPDLIYEHMRAQGSLHQFAYWGSAMYSLGYHPLYAVGRLTKNFVRREIPMAGSISMMGGYLRAIMGSSDPFISTLDEPLRNFVHAWQASRIEQLMTVLAERLSRS
jgi:glycosyltransferase involved in cell wall biosynthesis